MKTQKLFEAPRITFLQIASKDVIAVSGDNAPEVVFANQLDIWDEFV